ncbi:MAG: hypothetical protein KA354_09390 [Phycisphaerae bacterium]|nr:hypothetical protein [Phycisphaerae bacterium]
MFRWRVGIAAPVVVAGRGSPVTRSLIVGGGWPAAMVSVFRRGHGVRGVCLSGPMGLLYGALATPAIAAAGGAIGVLAGLAISSSPATSTTSSPATFAQLAGLPIVLTLAIRALG